MPLVATRTLVDRAAAQHVAVGSFNVITLEHVEAVIEGAEQVDAPVILQISENAVRFHHRRLAPIAAAATAMAEVAAVPVSLHLDHVQDDELLRQAATAGFGSVMYDASTLDYDKNVAATRAAREWAHAHGIYLEAELGEIGGKDGAHAPGVRTDPDEAARFVEETGVGALAVAVGSSHAMTERVASIDTDLVARLARAVPVPLVLHGSSGVPDESILSGIRAGLTKINVSTHLNARFTAAIREHLTRNPAAVDSRKYVAAGREAVLHEAARLLALFAVREA
jgi:fructose-bisphosphate aldolase class II